MNAVFECGKLMFSDDEETAKKARVEFLANVDEFMDTSTRRMALSLLLIVRRRGVKMILDHHQK